MKERAKFKGVVNLIIKQGDSVLMFRRTDGFFNHGDGWWIVPAGHIEQGETAIESVVREAKEELDIDVAPEDVEFAHIVSNLASKTECFDFFFVIKKYSGQLRNCEGDKCAEMRFISPEELKGLKNITTVPNQALRCIADGIKYSECHAYNSTGKD